MINDNRYIFTSRTFLQEKDIRSIFFSNERDLCRHQGFSIAQDFLAQESQEVYSHETEKSLFLSLDDE
jgi:hypothetical protein